MRCFAKPVLTIQQDDQTIVVYCMSCGFYENLGLDLLVDEVLEAEQHHADHEVPQ